MDDQKGELIGHIVAEKIQRPTLHIEEQENADGSRTLIRQCWSAITFTATIDPYEFAEKIFDEIRLTLGPMKISGGNESWTFYNARIALLPGSCFDPSSFVMIYDRCCRATDDDVRTSD